MSAVQVVRSGRKACAEAIEPKRNASRRRQPRQRERDQDDVRETESGARGEPSPTEEERERTSDDVGLEDEPHAPPAPRERLDE